MLLPFLACAREGLKIQMGGSIKISSYSINPVPESWFNQIAGKCWSSGIDRSTLTAGLKRTMEYGSLGCLGLLTAAVGYSPQQRTDISRLFFFFCQKVPFCFPPRFVALEFFKKCCLPFPLLHLHVLSNFLGKFENANMKNKTQQNKNLGHSKMPLRSCELLCPVFWEVAWLPGWEWFVSSPLQKIKPFFFFLTTEKTNMGFSANLPLSCHQAACCVLHHSPRSRVTPSPLEAVYKLPMFRWTFLLPSFSGSFRS